ncbi:MAG: cupin domain-containing protein [Deltaproteobacteria bacterium]|nr:cupin domain-containing protein [Deltaproteobacteria bacterium]
MLKNHCNAVDGTFYGAIKLGEEIYVLEPGDSIYYDSTVPHLVKNHGNDVTRILAVLYSEG